MLAKPKNKQQLGFFSTFEEQLNHQHPLYILANQIYWKNFDDAFKKHYCENNGVPAKPIRLMAELLILKHLRNLSDESIVDQWTENIYYPPLIVASRYARKNKSSGLIHFTVFYTLSMASTFTYPFSSA